MLILSFPSMVDSDNEDQVWNASLVLSVVVATVLIKAVYLPPVTKAIEVAVPAVWVFELSRVSMRLLAAL